jgi:hypothetical protein
MADNLKVVLAKFSALSSVAFVISVIINIIIVISK